MNPEARLAAPSNLLTQLNAAKAKDGGVILFWGERGIVARTPRLKRIAQLTSIPSSHPFINSAKTDIYYLATKVRQVRQLNLGSGADRLVAELPPRTNRCFHAKSAFEQIQMESDLRLNEKRGELCFDIGDRNENMVSVKMNFSVNLQDGRVRSAYTLVFDNCKEKGVAVERPKGVTATRCFATGRHQAWPRAT